MKWCDNKLNLDAKNQTSYNCNATCTSRMSMCSILCKILPVQVGYNYSGFDFVCLNLVYFHSISFMHFLAFDFSILS
jgi:hypothetical protein